MADDDSSIKPTSTPLINTGPDKVGAKPKSNEKVETPTLTDVETKITRMRN